MTTSDRPTEHDYRYLEQLISSVSPNPIALELGADGPEYFDRQRRTMSFYQLFPSPERQCWLDDVFEAISVFNDLHSPVAVEVLYQNGLATYQLLSDTRDLTCVSNCLPSTQHASLEQDRLYSDFRASDVHLLHCPYRLCLRDYYSLPLHFPMINWERRWPANIVVSLVPLFRDLHDDALGFYQLLFVPCRRDWGWTFNNLMRADDGALGHDPVHSSGYRLKTACPNRLFSCAIRVGGFVHFSQLNSFSQGLDAIVSRRVWKHAELFCFSQDEYTARVLSREDQLYMLFNRVAYRPGMLLSCTELGLLFPQLGGDELLAFPEIAGLKKSYPAPHTSRRTGQVIGCNVHQGHRTEVRIGSQLPNEHVYIVGKSGYGKTTCIENLIRHHLRSNDGFGVIDPHGDLIKRILPLIPSNRVSQTTYFAPAESDHLVSFNVLANEGTAKEREHLRAELLDFFEELSGAPLGVNVEHVLNHALITLLSRRNSTLADIKRLLIDKVFRDEALRSINNPDLALFWQSAFPQWFKAGGLMSITNKISPIVMPDSLIAPVLTSPANELDFKTMMDQSQIFLCDVSRGELTRRYSKLLGRLILSRITITAMLRDTSKQLAPWYLYVDEVQDMPSRCLEEILQGGRKFGLHLRLANQAKHDLPETLQRAIGNAATTVLFAISDVAEAAEAERFLDRKFSAGDIGSLPKLHSIVKMDRDVFNLVTPETRPEASDAGLATIRKQFIKKRPIPNNGGNMKPKQPLTVNSVPFDQAPVVDMSKPYDEL